MVLTQIIFMNTYQYVEKLFGGKQRLVFFSALITGLMFLLGSWTKFVPLVVLVILVGAGFGLGRRALLFSYMNKYIPLSTRATVFSTVSMFR